ncbi:MAG TPA: hypothetical protein VJP81_01055 [Candidatus Dormibacteraeota bacterium]|nr:hypothetical protein [Candidatus Dormibacteraeota bacterium]
MAPDPNSPAISYDREAGIFLPVRASWIAPDGMSYVDREGYAIHLKTVHAQSDRVFQTRRDASATSYPSTDVFLIGWSGGLIYYATRGYGEGADLWTIDPNTGRQDQVAPVQSGSEWWYAGPNAIWGSAYYTGRIARYDTKTHAVSSWWVDGLLEIIGLNSAGDPIILSGPRWTASGDRWNDIGQLAVMPANGRATLLGSGSPVIDAEVEKINVVADADRIWVSTNDLGLWLYSPDTGLELVDKISNTSLQGGLVVAGRCVSREEVRAAVSGPD